MIRRYQKMGYLSAYTYNKIYLLTIILCSFSDWLEETTTQAFLCEE